MPTPPRTVLVERLRSYADDLTATTQLWAADESVSDTLADTAGVAKSANNLGDVIEKQSFEHVEPITANYVVDFNASMKKIAQSAPNEELKAQLLATVAMMTAFVGTEHVRLTDDGWEFVSADT
jgi:hypothetical protein